MAAVYTSKKCELDRHNIIAHALIHGAVNHADAEGFNPRCTVIRSRVPEIHWDLGWPLENHEQHGRQAIYRMDFEDLATKADRSVELIKEAAKDWITQGKKFSSVFTFLEFVKTYRVRDMMADRMNWKLYRSQKKVQREEARGELWLW